MPAFIITGVPGNVKSEFITTSLPLDTETVISVVPVGSAKVGIVYDSTAELNSHMVDVLVKGLMDALRENTLKSS